MRRLGLIGLLALLPLASLSLAAAEPAPATAAPAPGFTLQKVAEGVYATIRNEPPGLMFNANTVFLINERDVIVVDTGITPSSAREAIAALRGLTDKPVRYVINTHWHDDHITGNQVYREAFPGVEFIGQATTLEDEPTVGASNRAQLLENGPAFADQVEGLVAQGKSLDGSDLDEEERQSQISTVTAARRYFAEAKGVEIVPPTLIVEDRLTLLRGERVIDVRYLGRAHTRADLVVHLPKEGIVITGDLVVWPVPLVGSTSYPADYAATLARLLDLHATTYVPGHGPVLRDDAYVRQMLGLLTAIKDQTAAAVARGETLEQARKSVDLSAERRLFAGGSKLRGLIFDFYVAGPGVAAAFRQATAPVTAAPAPHAG